MIDFNSDLATFFNPAEFGVLAVIALPDGEADITGTPSTYADTDRPGANQNSGISAFMVGAADFGIQPAQFLTAWQPVASAVPDALLTIQDGDYAGRWRVRRIERDGALARLILNKQP